MKAVFLDRDGTLNVDKGYLHKIDEFELYTDVIDGLKRLSDFALFVVTNQSGIGRGIYSESDMHTLHDHMLAHFRKEGVKIREIYFCPHHPNKKCDCRKPIPKFAFEAKKAFGIELTKSFMVGDFVDDVRFGKNAGLRTVYLLTGRGVQHLSESRKYHPDYIAANFTQAVDFILFDQKQKIIDRNSISAIAISERKKGKRIVTLNGTFDILHAGHRKILEEAKKQGDVLIVAVNSDQSVRGNKGPERPFNNELARASMIAAFNEVSYVTIFNEATPIALLEEIRPDVHVNGSEYGKDCIEAPTVRKHGGKIHIVSLLPGHSSTQIISGKPEVQ